MMNEGFILAGGQSRRLGQSKALLTLRGKTLLEMAVETLESAGFKSTVVAASNQEYREFSFQVVSDLIPNRGPLGGLFTALCKAGSNWIALHTCDCPRIPSGFFRKLVIWSHGFDIVIPQDSRGQLHPLSGAYSKNCLPAIEELVNQKCGRVLQLLESPELKTRILKSEEHGLSQRLLLNVNTRQDYQELQRGK